MKCIADKFVPSSFNITLISVAKERHTVIKSQVSYASFAPSLIIANKNLPAGSYMVMVDVRWN